MSTIYNGSKECPQCGAQINPLHELYRRPNQKECAECYAVILGKQIKGAMHRGR